jgi:glutaredoxin
MIVSRMRVAVYIKANCSLCEQALELLDDEGVSYSTHLIVERQEWFERWRFVVPVLEVDGVERLSLRFTVEQLRVALGRT